MIFERGLPETLRALRQERGLSLAGAAHRAGVSANSLQSWESGRQAPKGRSLARVLDALEAPERTRARLLSLADPRHARLALAKGPLGPPLSLGTVLRAMRVRRGATQSDLARTLGVTQGTVARWESGDATPSAGSLHEAGFALGATAEETVALASAQGGVPDGLPDEPGLVAVPEGLPLRLREIVALGYEAELWRRAARDARWETALGSVIAARANLCAGDRRYREIPALAERAMRLATTPEGRRAAVPAVNALTEHALQRGGSPLAAARTCDDWAERLAPSGEKAWMLGGQGLYLLRAGQGRAGLELMARACDMDEEEVGFAYPLRIRGIGRAQTMGEALLLAGRPEAAAEAVAPHRYRESSPFIHARVEQANGRPLDEASLAYLRHFLLRVPANVCGKGLVGMEAIERAQARLTGEPPAAALADPFPDAESAEAESRRLWAAVPGARPWPERA